MNIKGAGGGGWTLHGEKPLPIRMHKSHNATLLHTKNAPSECRKLIVLHTCSIGDDKSLSIRANKHLNFCSNSPLLQQWFHYRPKWNSTPLLEHHQSPPSDFSDPKSPVLRNRERGQGKAQIDRRMPMAKSDIKSSIISVFCVCFVQPMFCFRASYYEVSKPRRGQGQKEIARQ